MIDFYNRVILSLVAITILITVLFIKCYYENERFIVKVKPSSLYTLQGIGKTKS